LSPVRFAHYNPKAGFFFRCDYGYNLKFKGGGLFSKAGEPTKILYSLCPPGDIYMKGKKDMKKNSYFTLKTDWKSPCCYPKYEGEKQTFNIPYDPKACFIIECKGLKMEAKDKKDKKNGSRLILSDNGWGILPIFQQSVMEGANGHVICGYFQVPLFAGRPSKKLIEELMNTNIDAANLLDRETSNKGKNGKYKLKPVDGNGMLLVKLLDCQLYGMAKTFLKDINPRYTFFDQKKYKYEKEKHKETSHTLTKLVPKGQNPEEYEESLNQQFATRLKLEDAGVELLDIEEEEEEEAKNDSKDKKKKKKEEKDVAEEKDSGEDDAHNENEEDHADGDGNDEKTEGE
jgi:hypothetical protein